MKGSTVVTYFGLCHSRKVCCVTRETPHQIVLDDGRKFWKESKYEVVGKTGTNNLSRFVTLEEEPEYLAELKEISESQKEPAKVSDDPELWQVRAEALLPILQAAVKITHNPNFSISGKAGAVLIPQKEYEALCEAVETFRLAAKQEQETS